MSVRNYYVVLFHVFLIYLLCFLILGHTYLSYLFKHLCCKRVFYDLKKKKIYMYIVNIYCRISKVTQRHAYMPVSESDCYINSVRFVFVLPEFVKILKKKKNFLIYN